MKQNINFNITGILLAGGEAKRFGGGDKCLTILDGTTLLERTIKRTSPQTRSLVLNANGDPGRFSAYNLPVVADESGAYGPLAGVLAGMEWSLVNAPGNNTLVASFATDAPFLPHDMVKRLHIALNNADADVAYARSGELSHPVFALWKVSLSHALREALIIRGERKVRAFISTQKAVSVDWPTTSMDPFLNINTPSDLEQACGLLRK